MTEYTEEELAESDNINKAIDAMTELVISAGISIATNEERDGPMNALLIAEGVLGRIMAAFAVVYGGGEQPGLDDLQKISAGHICTLSQNAWDRLSAIKAAEFEDDAAPDA